MRYKCGCWRNMVVHGLGDGSDDSPLFANTHMVHCVYKIVTDFLPVACVVAAVFYSRFRHIHVYIHIKAIFQNSQRKFYILILKMRQKQMILFDPLT